MNTNEQIALEREWRSEFRRPDPDDPESRGKEYWFSPGSDKPQHLPDFEHDWAHAGPLWDNLVNNVGLDKAFNRVWHLMTDDTELELIGATCAAWLAWKKEEA